MLASLTHRRCLVTGLTFDVSSASSVPCVETIVKVNLEVAGRSRLVLMKWLLLSMLQKLRVRP